VCRARLSFVVRAIMPSYKDGMMAPGRKPYWPDWSCGTVMLAVFGVTLPALSVAV
jgi:hypothetical protein